MPILSAIGAACARAFGMFGGNTVSASYLVVAGGGGGGCGTAGGGGAGGLLTGTQSLDLATTYVITVGAGGSGSSNTALRGSTGSNSVFSSSTASGGGGGGSNESAQRTGGNGGSGGGAGNDYSGATASGGTGTSGQGNNGGSGSGYAAGGGGGAGAAGGNASSTTTGNGGNGSASSISGSSVTYAGGGGGGARTDLSQTQGTGGTGGGGNGGYPNAGSAGTSNLGGGGGGSGYGAYSGGNGGSGIVIVSYAGTQKFGGGVVTSVGGNTIHTFTTSGSLTPISPITASYLIVAGGGAGGGETGGGGGAGGLLTGSTTLDTNSIYTITVGAGGTGSATAVGGNGTNSTFLLTTTGGGGGGSLYTTSGNSGGSGGGGGYASGTGGAGNTPSTSPSQGNNGGTGGSGGGGTTFSGGGGGGASAVGTSGSLAVGGAGGAGTASSISGSSVTYAGGGGGSSGSSPAGSGGSGGGGAGNVRGVGSPTAGTANTGGGGGGSGNTGGAGANGGSGIVIISYPGSTQLMAGGTVTISGGNVIHTFTSTGYLAPIKYLTNSLRFRSSASAYLNRTFTTPTNNKIYTWSGWVKRGKIGVDSTLIGTTDDNTASGNFSACRFTSNNILQFFSYSSGYDFQLDTSQVFRDPSAWYHIVLAVDTTQATASNRIKIYVNGSQVTAFSTATYPSQNLNTYINSAIATYQAGYINAGTGVVAAFDGYMTEVNFIDGQALTPNSFGTFNSYGVWQPIAYAGSYGTNGFYLPFTNTSSTTTLGYDFSGNSNNWTTNNISLTAGSTYDAMTDVPTLTSATASNFCTLNPISNPNGTIVTYSDGNLAFSHSSSSGNAPKMSVQGTIALTASKFYWEYTVGSTVNDQLGIGTMLVYGGSADGTAGARYLNNGTFQSGYTNPSTAASYTTNDVIGMAYDQPNGTLAFYKNNSLQGTITNISTSEVFFPLRSPNSSGSGGSGVFNFGQRPFTYTPPSGYVALNTYNM